MRFSPSNIVFPIAMLLLFSACNHSRSKPNPGTSTYLMVLGIAQDAGYPQAACTKACCRAYHDGLVPEAFPVSLALVDQTAQRYWLFEASPAIREQLQLVYDQTTIPSGQMPEGIFLTHAHIGHYAGLLQLGREVMGAKAVPVYAMPRMQAFLRQHGPWEQLIALENIELYSLRADSVIQLPTGVSVTPIPVPHRDEYSETVGFRIDRAGRKVLFIPDIDKWDVWDRDIVAEVQAVDVALLDGTFFAADELPGRDMSEIPHPFIPETMERLQGLSPEQRKAVHFIHFNHTNRLLFDEAARTAIRDAGYKQASRGQKIPM